MAELFELLVQQRQDNLYQLVNKSDKKIRIFRLPRRQGNTLLLQRFAEEFKGDVYVMTTNKRKFEEFQQGVTKIVYPYKELPTQIDFKSTLVICDVHGMQDMVMGLCDALNCRSIVCFNDEIDGDWYKTTNNFAYFE